MIHTGNIQDKIQEAKDTLFMAEAYMDYLGAEFEQEVKLFMQDNELANSDCFRVSWKNIDSTRLDAKRIRAEKPEIYEDYGMVSHPRRFEVKAA